MDGVTRRAVPRFENVEFELFDDTGNSRQVIALDASAETARFQPVDESELDQADTARFRIDGTEFRAVDIHKKLSHKEGSVYEYKVSPQPPKESRWARWLRRVRTAVIGKKRSELDPRQRYVEPALLPRIVRFILPERVSRIYLYDAQERWVHLQVLLDYYGEDASVKRSPRKRAVFDICRHALNSTGLLLTRRQSDLNFLWREMTQVHVAILQDLCPNGALPGVLDFCREEARGLAVAEDPIVKELIQRAAEVMDDTGQNRARKVRTLRALIQRFTAIRVGRMHEQLANIRTYVKGLLMLAPIAALLVLMEPLILGDEIQTGILPSFGSLDDFLGYFRANTIAFVFFGGLTGGFMSVIIRLRSRKLLPGEDAYFTWYVLTKPWVGALGAAILFILLHSGIVSSDINQLLVGNTEQPSLSALFAFAFIAGFSERIAFPTLRGTGLG